MARPENETQAVSVRDALQRLHQEITSCHACNLRNGARLPVPGSKIAEIPDLPRVPLLIVGEAPGREEDIQGAPFVGWAGKFLRNVLRRTYLTDLTYITNLVKCRPPENRDPEPQEIIACSPHLDRQIEIARPHIILALGRFSAGYIWEKFLHEKENRPFPGITRVNGQVFPLERNDERLYVSFFFHLAYVLRQARKGNEALPKRFRNHFYGLRIMLEDYGYPMRPKRYR
ncbi:uracil-DNA glycosylase [Thermosulfurimonas marina]|uniref:Type-4 uracil-DNA glycosylase n=1 Tax=Thermosulfurimonas marina TaxID=2047767 RepID=A0A6H1WUG5_9BACT|nr:uracil-DNA glycosylase [Thermosulfurimonas marina]QJA06842.1 uracil-DNA glycosylase [Thermosulfurimonas marina]